MALNLLERYRRWRHSHGFGVHSPWAYGIVMDVLALGSRYGYYDYAAIDRTFGRDARLAHKVYALIVHLQPSAVTVAGSPLWAALATSALGDIPGSNGRMLLIADPAAFVCADGYEYLILTCLDTEDGRMLWQRLVAEGGFAIDTRRRIGIIGRRPDLPNQLLELRTALPTQ